MEIRFCHKDIEKFIASLEKQTVAKVLRTLDLLERFGHQLGMPTAKHWRQGYSNFASVALKKYGCFIRFIKSPSLF